LPCSLLALTPSDLATGTTIAPLSVDAFGSYEVPPNSVSTGAIRPDIQGTASDTCNDWTSTGPALESLFGDASSSGPWSFGISNGGCEIQRQVYCLEQ
jgi:hypothetical protein